jgi:hypothetical protein
MACCGIDLAIPQVEICRCVSFLFFQNRNKLRTLCVCTVAWVQGGFFFSSFFWVGGEISQVTSFEKEFIFRNYTEVYLFFQDWGVIMVSEFGLLRVGSIGVLF